METFRAFTLTHGVALLAIALLIAVVVVIGRRQRATAPTAFEKSLAIANLLVWLIAHGWWQLPPRFDPAITLPLQMCHLTSLIATSVLLTRHHTLRTVLYFWSFGLCTQALITPSLTDPPASPIFWSFWFLHGFVMLAAVYDLIVYRYRPTWRDYGIACIASAAYMALVLPINIALGSNYGFVGNSKPQTPSIVDLLGPWPQRLLIIVPLVAVVLALLMLPWALPWPKRRASHPAPP